MLWRIDGVDGAGVGVGADAGVADVVGAGVVRVRVRVVAGDVGDVVGSDERGGC